MSAFQFRFNELDSDKSFLELADTLKSKYAEESIKINPECGSGIIRKVKLEEGLHLRVWDFCLNNSIIFQRDYFSQTAEKFFHIVYLLRPRSITPGSVKMDKAFPLLKLMNIMFVSNDLEVQFQVDANVIINGIDVSFTSSWLLNAFKKTDTASSNILSHLICDKKPAVFMDSCTLSEYKTLTDLYEKAIVPASGLIQIKGRILILMSEFFARLFLHEPHELQENRNLHSHRMREVENILIDHLQKKLPCIEKIAQDMAMSESTLKRHFKIMFGKSIYDHYLDLKMDMARRMLQEQPLTVSEVASTLDYEKTSSFIEMFKKHYGYCPGDIRKNGVLR